MDTLRILRDRLYTLTLSSATHAATPRRRHWFRKESSQGWWRMPFESQGQRRKVPPLLVEGKISNETFEEWNRETGGRKLPERVRRKAAARKQPVKKTRASGTKRR